MANPSDVPVAQAGAAAPALAAGNQAPAAADDCAVTDQATVLRLPVLDNDLDGDADPLAITSVTQPASGRVTIDDDGRLTFTPEEPGRQSFAYEVGDGRGGSASAKVELFVNPADGTLPAPALAGLDGQALSQLAEACARGLARELRPLAGAAITVPAPEPGQRIQVEAQPGQLIELADPAFAEATYIVVDHGLLIVTTDGRMVFLADFVEAAQAAPTATLAIAGGAPVGADVLLAEVQPLVMPAAGPAALATAGLQPSLLSLPEPAAGPEGGGDPGHGGGAGFSPYDPAVLGPGLDPQGPLGPTALGPGPEITILGDPGTDSTGGLDGSDPGDPGGPGGPGEPGGPDDPGEPGGPDNLPPELTVSAEVGIDVGEVTRTPEFASGPALPNLYEKQPVQIDRINGVDQHDLVVGAGGDVAITFRDEIAGYQNTLGVYLIGEHGEILAPKIVFSPIEHALGLPDYPSARPGGGPLQPGDQVMLSELYGDAIAPGTRFGLFLIQDGHGLNGPLDGADLRFEAAAGGPAMIGDQAPPRLLAGDAKVGGEIYHVIGQDAQDPTLNPLNPGGKEQALSGFAPDGSGLTVAFEDSKLGTGDGDFNDVLVDVELSPEIVSSLKFVSFKIALDLAVADDSGQLGQAVVEVGDGFQPGDQLSIDPALLAGTGISLVEDGSAGRLVLSGLASAADYQEVLRSVTFKYAPDSGGPRNLTFEVVDGEGLASGPQTVTINPTFTSLAGTDGDDQLIGSDLSDDVMSGRAGNDELRGLDGNDLMDGGLGRDLLSGGEGDDLLFGGPGADQLYGGNGADRFVYFSLAERGDVIHDFDVTKGDVLDFSELLDMTGSNGVIGDFVQFETGTAGADTVIQVSVDVDGTDPGFGAVPYLTLVNPTGVATPEDAVASANLVA
jgi:hypothetical protein